MATYTKEEYELFVDRNIDCEVAGLIEWIAGLLPQDDFDRYIDQIRSEEIK